MIYIILAFLNRGIPKLFLDILMLGNYVIDPWCGGISRSLTICHVVRRGHEGHASYPPWVVISNGTPSPRPTRLISASLLGSRT